MKEVFHLKNPEIICIIGIIVLIIFYFFQLYTIQCEPCLLNTDCPPCETNYMKNIVNYISLWTSVFSIPILINFWKK
jgi:hypothetical protein